MANRPRLGCQIGWRRPTQLEMKLTSPSSTTVQPGATNGLLECSTRNTIRLKLNPKPKDARLRLVGILDNRGTQAENIGGGFGDDQFDAQWKIAQEAESITIPIGLSEMRYFEFLAQPVRQ